MNTKPFKQGADFTGWLRAPAAERYLKDLDGQVSAALGNLLGQCASSTDPQVTGRYQNWKTLSDMSKFLHNSRKEGSTDDDE